MVPTGKDTEELVPEVNVQDLFIMVPTGEDTEELVPEANVKDLNEEENFIMAPQPQQIHKGKQKAFSKKRQQHTKQDTKYNATLINLQDIQSYCMQQHQFLLRQQFLQMEQQFLQMAQQWQFQHDMYSLCLATLASSVLRINVPNPDDPSIMSMQPHARSVTSAIILPYKCYTITPGFPMEEQFHTKNEYLNAKEYWLQWHRVTPATQLYEVRPSASSSSAESFRMGPLILIGWLRPATSPVESQRIAVSRSKKQRFDRTMLLKDYLPFYSEDDLLSSDVSDSGRGISDTEEESVADSSDDEIIVVINS